MALLRGRVAEEERARAASAILCRSLADETQQLRRTLAATAHMCQHLVKCLDERQRAQGDAGERSPEVGHGAGRSRWGRPGVGRRPLASRSSGAHLCPHGRGRARPPSGFCRRRSVQSAVGEQAAASAAHPPGPSGVAEPEPGGQGTLVPSAALVEDVAAGLEGQQPPNRQ